MDQNITEIYPEERIALLIDGAYTIGFKVDFSALHDFFAELGRLNSCYYYTTINAAIKNNKAIDFINYLGKTKYVVKTRNYYQNDTSIPQPSMTSTIITDALLMHNRIDHLIITGNDPEYTPAIKAIVDRGTKVSFLAERDLLNNKIKESASYVIDINELPDEVVKKNDISLQKRDR